MADRPIIFSGPLVRALLAGTKSQTRRVLRLQPIPFAVDDHGTLCDVGCLHVQGDRLPRVTLGRVVTLQEVPYAVGDRLWVREAWAPLDALTHNDPGTRAMVERGFYRADEGTVAGEISRWRPSIHMPRWASRLTLTVGQVAVERLQDITEEAAQAEGVCHFVEQHERSGSWAGLSSADRALLVGQIYGSSRKAFQHLWETLHGTEAWAANPWVAAISFAVTPANIDRLPEQL